MAYSPFQDTVFILDFINNLNPRSILDVGSGFGRWGFLCRCHFAGGISLAVKPDQALRIDAVEAFGPNVSAVYAAVYNRTFTGDAREVVPRLGAYDVIICSHMIEHLEKAEGRALIETMRQQARMALILGLPFNDPLREPIEGNEYEAHRSVWTAADFEGQSALVRSFRFLKRTDAGVVIYPRDDNARWHVKTLRNPLRALAVRHCPRLLRGLRRLALPPT